MPVKTPKISIIVTAFNDEKYIDTCLKSLENQTEKNLEIIVIDDASTDKTIEKVESHKGIKLIKQPKNSGPAAARNVGLKIATAPYIMFCDGDDFYDETFCEKMLSAVTKYHVDFACAEIKVSYESKNKIKASDDGYYCLKLAGREIIDKSNIKKVDMSVDNKIFRADLIKKHHIEFPNGILYEDTYFVLAYLAFARHAFFLKEPLYHYVRHAGSIMDHTFSEASDKDRSLDCIKIFTRLYDFLEAEQAFNGDNPLTKDNTEIFYSFFADFFASAKLWAKTKDKKREITAAVETFEKQHNVRIKRFLPRPLHIIIAKVIRKFIKIGNSQKWTLIKLEQLNLKAKYQLIVGEDPNVSPASKPKD